MSARDCVNCVPGCFDSTGDGCIDVSVTNDTLDIKAGIDSLATALAKIMDAVVCLQDEACNPCDACSDSSSTTTELGTISTLSPSKSTSTKPFNLNITPSKTNTSIQYDLRNALEKEGTHVVNVEAFGNQSGIPSRVYRSSSQLATFNAAPENFPLTLAVDVTSLTPQGQVISRYEKTIQNIDTNTDEYLEVSDLGTESVSSQKDVNEHFDRQVVSLKNQVSGLDKITLNGKVGFNDILSDLQRQIDSLKSS